MPTQEAQLAAKGTTLAAPTLLYSHSNNTSWSASTESPAYGASASKLETIETDDSPATKEKKGKGLHFWLVFLAICTSCFLSALDFTAVSTVLPTIAHDFDSPHYGWVGSAYALTSTCLIPWTGGLAFIFGRRAVLLAALFVFGIGSAICGASHSMEMLIAGRALQGCGGGAVLATGEIIVVDLVPIVERGLYFGLLGFTWAGASAIGPPIGGALATANAWRWLFYLNLPLTGIAMVLVAFFLRIKTPQTTLKEKLDQMDYVSNLLFVASSTSTILGLTWGGVDYEWSSYKVLVPLILGLVGMAVFIFLERSFVKVPTVPFEILNTRTSILGYLTTWLHGIIVMSALYCLPLYFTACFGASPIQSGVDLFPVSFVVAPFAIFAGISITVTGHYRWQNLAGWVICVVAFGVMTLFKANSEKSLWVPVTAVLGVGGGILFSTTNFAALAGIKPSQQPHGMAFYAFTRSFGQCVGISVATTIVQNRLAQRLPLQVAAAFGNGKDAVAAIPLIAKLDAPWNTLVRMAFADSLRTLWLVCCAVSGVGLVLSVFIKSIPLATESDENWGLEDRQSVETEEEKV
ncbi:hypothetical protein JCM10207_006761 [Rhodosporidiobolus poonsookiae]